MQHTMRVRNSKALGCCFAVFVICYHQQQRTYPDLSRYAAVVLSVNGAKSATSPIRRVALLASGRAQAGRGGPGRAEWST